MTCTYRTCFNYLSHHLSAGEDLWKMTLAIADVKFPHSYSIVMIYLPVKHRSNNVGSWWRWWRLILDNSWRILNFWTFFWAFYFRMFKFKNQMYAHGYHTEFSTRTNQSIYYFSSFSSLNRYRKRENLSFKCVNGNQVKCDDTKRRQVPYLMSHDSIWKITLMRLIIYKYTREVWRDGKIRANIFTWIRFNYISIGCRYLSCLSSNYEMNN